MPAIKYDLTIEKGANLNLSMLLKNPDNSIKDLSEYTARMHIRQYVFDNEFLLELTTENGRIVFGLVSGSVILRLTAAETASLPFKRAVYDLELVHSSGNVIRLIEGTVNISPEVTR